MATYPQQFIDALEFLTEDSSTHTPQVRIDDAVRAVEVVAKRQGLTSEHIDSLMEVVVGQRRGSIPSRSRVVRCLIPRSTVSCSSALRALSGLKGLPISLQHLLFRWIVLVFDVIDDTAPLHAVYNIIMHYIQVDDLVSLTPDPTYERGSVSYEFLMKPKESARCHQTLSSWVGSGDETDLRPTVCQLLCYLTRREDVLEFRVHRLVELQKHVLAFKGTEPSLTALLAVYKMYCPHLVSMALPKRRKVWFRPFEKALAANIKKIQELNLKESQQPTSGAAERLMNHIVTAPPPAKRARRGITSVPTLHSSTSYHQGRSGVTVGQLTSLEELCDSIDKLELPGQMAVVLESGLLKHLFCMWSDPSTALRLTYWLEHTLGYELDEYSPGSENTQLLHLLKCLVEMSEFILEPIPTVESFLSILLEVWNGSDYQNEVLQLLTHLSLQPFEGLQEEYLDPLKQLCMKKDIKFKYDCLLCFTALLRNFTVLEWPRYQGRVENTSMKEGSQRWLSIFSSGEEEEEMEDFEPTTMLKLFIKYVNSLIVVTLEQEGNHALIQHAAMCFYEEAAKLPETHGISVLSLPHHTVVFRGLLHSDVVTLSRMCAVLVSCRQSLSNLKRSQRDLQLTHSFNSIVLDLCDTLWRNRAFSNDSRPYPTLLFHLSREFLESCQLHSVHEKLSIIHHPALVPYVHKFFSETQERDKQLHPAAIWREARFKEAYMDFLKQNHLNGLVDFIKSFVRSRT